MFCNDQSITYLKSFGYNVVRVPKANIQPLQILIKEGNVLKPIGHITTLLVTGNAAGLPEIEKDVPAVSISGQKTSDLKVGLGISILGSIIGAMGGSKLGLEASYAQAKSISFEFLSVFEDSFEVAKLDQFLTDADVNPLSRYVADLLEADEIYIITSILKSDQVTVHSKKNSATGVEVDVPVIKEVIGGNIKVNASSNSSSTVTYQGKMQLVFGFQAIRLFYEDGKYRSFKHLKSGQGAVGAKPPQSPDYYTSESTFVNI